MKYIILAIAAFIFIGCATTKSSPTVVRNVEVQLVQVPITVNIPEI